MLERAIVDSIEEKVLETIGRTEHLVALAPADRLEWRPELPANLPAGNDLGHLVVHILDCLAGFCAAFYAASPVELADLGELRSLPVNQFCGAEEVRTKMKVYLAAIQRGFRCCADADLARRIPTVFVPEGETLMTLLLGNLEHLINHKYQLFFYLKLAGVAVDSRDLYKWRGHSEPGG